jgi:TatD DNase family protein
VVLLGALAESSVTSVLSVASLSLNNPMLIDTHAHLDADDFRDDLDAVLARAHAAGVTAMILPAVSADSSEACILLAETHEDLYPAVGIQPNDCADAKPGDWERIERLAMHPRVVALGETGLDRYWDFTPFALQQDYFERHLRLAQQRDLPVIIHCREAEADLLPMLRAAIARVPLRGVLHSFSGDREFAAECVGLGMMASFTGAVTYTNKKFESLWIAAASVPDDRILVETDSPYLIPHPLRGKQKRNEPALLTLTVRRLAELRSRTVEELAAQTTANARRLFRLSM